MCLETAARRSLTSTRPLHSRISTHGIPMWVTVSKPSNQLKIQPSLTVHLDCSGLPLGAYVCVGVPGTPTAPVTTASPTNDPSKPSPTQDNVTKDCESPIERGFKASFFGQALLMTTVYRQSLVQSCLWRRLSENCRQVQDFQFGPVLRLEPGRWNRYENS